jgi:hypothetical protein
MSINILANDHGLLLCWHLKNSQPGNRSRLELLMFKFSTKSHYKIGQAEAKDDRRVKLKYNCRASIAANRLLPVGGQSFCRLK